MDEKDKRKGSDDVQEQIRAVPSDSTEHFDVIIAGAVSLAWARLPLTRNVRGRVSWPSRPEQLWRKLAHAPLSGIRSDSDFIPSATVQAWTSAPIATAAEILSYMGEVIEENGLAPTSARAHISRPLVGRENLWTSSVRADTGEVARSPRTSSGCAKGTTGTRRGIRPSERHGELQGRSFIRRNGR